MKEYEEIKDIIVNKLGLKDLATYNTWLKQFFPPEGTERRVITPEDIELLSPDNVHNGHFWQIAEELFGIDCVANTKNLDVQNHTSANVRNLALARMAGALCCVDEWRHQRLKVLEIGAGYGWFKQYCMFNTNFNYLGLDVYPKIDGVAPTTPEGFIPESIMNEARGSVNMVFSSNVFQHLSSKQRSRYFKDVASLLDDKFGLFIMNLMVHFDNPAQPKVTLSTDGRRYLHHYGQLTEIPYYYELMDELQSSFEVLYETRRISDSLFNFVMTKKVVPVVPTPPPVPETKPSENA